jgi:hypothetical protein
MLSGEEWVLHLWLPSPLRSSGIRVIPLYRPEKKNVLTEVMYAEMTRAPAEAASHEAIRCIMLAGAPGAFIAGADIGEFVEAAQTGGLRRRTVQFLKALARNPKPLVAAVCCAVKLTTWSGGSIWKRCISKNACNRTRRARLSLCSSLGRNEVPLSVIMCSFERDKHLLIARHVA